MNKNTSKVVTGIAVLALIVASVAIFMPGRASDMSSSEPIKVEIVSGDTSGLGGATSFQKNSFTEGFYAGTGRQFEVDRSGVPIFGLTTSTSTEKHRFFCIEYYATSSETTWNLKPKVDGLDSSTTTPLIAAFGSC